MTLLVSYKSWRCYLEPRTGSAAKCVDGRVRLVVELVWLISGRLPRIVVGGYAEVLASRASPELKIVPPVTAERVVGPSGYIYEGEWEDDWEDHLAVLVRGEIEAAGFSGVVGIDTWGWDVDSSAEMSRRASVILVTVLMRLSQTRDLDSSKDEVLSIIKSW